jgi:hypothetical protein
MADLDPSKNPQEALDFVVTSLAQLTKAQADLELWFNALVQQLAWNVIRCKDVVAYNVKAIGIYNTAVDLFTWVKPALDSLSKQTNQTLLTAPEVPYPKLIGTRFIVHDRGGGRKDFDFGVLCNPDGSFSSATPRSALYADPPATPSYCAGDGGLAGPMNVTAALVRPQVHPTSTDLRFAGFGQVPPSAPVVAAAGISWAAVAIFGLKATAVAVVLWQFKDLLSVLSGLKRDQMNAALYDAQLTAEKDRAERITACYKIRIESVGGLIDVATSERWYQECVDQNERVTPPDYAGDIISGVFGIVVAGGAIWLSVVALKAFSNRGKRGGGGDSDSDY